MNKKIVHVLLPALLGLTLLPVRAAHGQYQAQGEYADVRSQDYLRDVVALASTLGSAHAIRVLCNGRNDQYWRSYMQELLGLEAPYQGRLRSSMVDAFNSAYSAEAARRNSCDAGAVSAEKVYASTGERLANSLVQANLPEAARRSGEDND
ncbi:TIGR02301 family protein [Henriciella sp.]|jgi:uncharacterized protein (TIGR02301 family)|uniref:TIGR02301 family protein n=1 Tax=Henriciella sp. TaxID=1968823 RepID=UPI0025C16C76|nr:TIGR02301 family protein [Henriciella sp.]|tara:strand:- start:34 stop:486 length:453 start_codon:yes stop_codon:yes gene_type:complete